MAAIRNIFYLCPCSKEPCGGVQKIYQHVDALNHAGMNAFVLHLDKGYRYPWRENQTKIAYLDSGRPVKEWYHHAKQRLKKAVGRDVYPFPVDWKILNGKHRVYCMEEGRKVFFSRIDDQDVLVFNEFAVPQLKELVGKFPSAILNLTPYTTYYRMTIEEALNSLPSLPYDHRCLACIVGSADAENYLKYAFPKLSPFLCPFGVDTDQFLYHENKERKIAFMPRKCRDHLVQIIQILRQRNLFPHWSFVSLENLPQEQLVHELRTSAIYLSTSYMEGFGLPPAEALSSGTLVVGYDGEGGREFFLPPFAHPVPHGDIIGFVKKTEELMALFERDQKQFMEFGKMGSEFIGGKYSIEEENKKIVEIWKEISAGRKG